MPVHAQTARTLVSNFDVGGSTSTVTINQGQAQQFTVDSVSDYTLTSVSIETGTQDPNTVRVAIHADNNGRPAGTSLYEMTPPDPQGSGVQEHTAPSGATLDKGKKYFVVVTKTGSGASIEQKNSNNEDSSGYRGWKIGNNSFRYSMNSWQSDSDSIRLKIRGYRVFDVTPITATLESFDTVEYADEGIHYLFDLKLSERVWIPFKDMRDHAFDVTNGTILKAKRVAKRKSRHNGRLRTFSNHWRITVEADDPADPVSVSLEAKGCSEQGALCSASGGQLANEPELDLEPPSVLLGVSIADTTASRRRARLQGQSFQDHGGDGGDRLQDHHGRDRDPRGRLQAREASAGALPGGDDLQNRRRADRR